VSLALTAGVNVHWLEGQGGVSYLVLRKHYGRYMTSEGPDRLAKMKLAEPDARGRDSQPAAVRTARNGAGPNAVDEQSGLGRARAVASRITFKIGS